MGAMEPKRHEALYFPDGNIIICAAGTGADGVVFRVHKSILGFHSELFADMFSLPTVEGVNDTYDGAPLVNTTDDARGWGDLLGLLCHTQALPYRPRDPMNPDNLGPTMALAVKYNFTAIKDEIVSKLQADWPSTLTDWDDSQYEVQQLLSRQSKFPFKSARNRVPEPVSAIRFAKDFHIPGILSAAFYMLSRTNVMHDWYQDGKENSAMSRLSARWSDLNAEELLIAFRGKESLIASWKGMRPDWLGLMDNANLTFCCSCDVERGEDTMQKVKIKVSNANNMLGTLKSILSANNFDGHACNICKTAIKKVLWRARTEL